jgi:hypothetical protein
MVFTSGETLGPWSAARIRDELRSGRIDPFDLVAQEGDPIRRPLVEVDAIFESSGFQVAEVLRDSVSRDSVSVAPEYQASAAKPEEKLAAGDDGDRPRVFEALAAPDLKANRSAQSGAAASAVAKKTYMLWIPGSQPRGPFVAKDVLKLWYSRQIPAATEVQRSGGSKKINVRIFAGYYEGAGVGATVRAADAGSSRWHYIIAAFAVVGLIIGVLWYASAPTRPQETGQRESMPVLPAVAEQTKVADETPMPGSQSSVIQPRQQPGQMTGELVPTPMPVQKAAPSPREKSVIKKSTSSSRIVSRRPDITPRRPSQNVSQARPVAASVPAIKPVVAAPVQPAAAAPPANGAIVTLTGYTFDPGALRACAGKCKILMNGPRGPVFVVFFKEAFGPQLAATGGRVTLTGQLRRDEATRAVTILLQSVR